MDGIFYPISLVVLALAAFGFIRNNSNFLALVAILVGVYVIYSHETGQSAGEIRNEIVETVDESTTEFIKSHGNE